MNDDFLEKVNVLKNNLNALGGYLIDNAKNNPQAIRYKDVYEGFLSSENWYLKKASIFALLSVFKLDDKKYIDKAISYITDPNEDEEVRRWSLNGLSQIYFGTKDRDLLAIFYAILLNENEEPSVRISSIRAMMALLGLPSIDVYNGQKKVRDAGNGDFNLEGNVREFYDQIQEAKRIIEFREGT